MKPYNETLNYNDVIKCKENKIWNTNLTVISNITLNPVFHKYAYYYNSELKINYIDVDKYLTLEEHLDTCFVILNIQVLAPYLYYHFYDLTKDEMSNEITKLEDLIKLFYHKLKTDSNLILFSAFESDFETNEVNGQVSFQYLINRLNRFITDLMSENDQFYIINIDKLIAKVGYSNFHNKINFYHTNSPYTTLACNMLAHHVLLLLEQIKNKSKKCLVLDCDNVLWGGIIGDDGIEGILLSNQYMGRAYLNFQREIIKLFYQGIIICLCSKNKLTDIKNIINNHPDMLLKEKFIAAMRVNYNNKADNIRELASELNINLDSIVFVDDNPYEISLINFELPEVATILLNPLMPYKYSEILMNSGYFFKKKITENDLLRGKQYKEQNNRLKNINLYSNLKDYHETLETEITIAKVDEYSIARVAELSQRTNQFNLSAKRYCLEELKLLLQSGYEILYLRAKDKFGDMGIVSAGIVKFYEDYAVIEAMFLSCRVFGRNFEVDLLEAIKKIVLDRNIKKLYGVYTMTSKNEIFKDFYEQNNITLYNC